MPRLFLLFMGVITALTVQQRNADRVNLFLDGVFAFGLATAVAENLKVGQRLSPEMIASLQQQDEVNKARQTAVQLIARRPRSVAEVERHLQKKGFVAEVVAQVIGRLQEVALLDDEAFARYWVEQRDSFKPRSHLALRQELGQKGVARTIVDAVLVDVDQVAAAQRAAHKQVGRYAHLDKAEFQQKLGAFLQRRGFHYGIILQVTDELWATIDHGDYEEESGEWSAESD